MAMVGSVTPRRKVVVYSSLAILIAIYLFPIYWTLVSSLKSTPELLTQTSLWPKQLVWTHYEKVLRGTPFLIFMRNSLLVGLAVAGITVVLSAAAAYPLSRLRFSGRKVFSQAILLVYLFPGILIVVPAFVMLVRTGMYNTLRGIVLMHILYTLPFGVWTVKMFFDNIPIEFEDAARVDGASRLGVLRRILIPLATPGLATATIFAFVVSWNEYLFASVLAADVQHKTLPVGIAEWSATYSIDWGQITAGSILTIVPAIIFFIFLGRFFVKGLTTGGIK